MFYCNDCAKLKGWPETDLKSVGRCEICEKHKECNERASEDPPPATPATRKKGKKPV